MKLVIGLGNPGSQYARTRHNVGFMTIDHFAEKWKIGINQQKFKALIGEGHVNGHKVLLLKPQTYMNLSGEAVRAAIDFYKVEIADILVVYDDLDISLGHIRLRYQGSAGGHNGIKSLVQHLGTNVFNRIRIGISRPEQPMGIIDYVLTPFAKSEIATLEQVLMKSVEALEFSLENSFEKTMARYNIKE